MIAKKTREPRHAMSARGSDYATFDARAQLIGRARSGVALELLDQGMIGGM
jgi:hypothetical protein